jgi:hypothetical protein
MNAFDENAFYLLVWRALLVALVAAILLLTHPFTPHAALQAAGIIALVFSLVLVACAAHLTENRITRSAAWRLLPLAKRPFGNGGRRWACNCLRQRMLQFAEGGSAVAIVSSTMALMFVYE